MNKLNPNHGMGWNKPDELRDQIDSLVGDVAGTTGDPQAIRDECVDDIMSLIAAHTAKAVAEAEKRGAAYAMCNLSYKTAMDGRKTVKASWIDSKGEDWAISAVKYAQANNMPVIGYNQFAREFNEKHPTSKQSNSAPSPAQENE